jgi:hypothetical protein
MVFLMAVRRITFFLLILLPTLTLAQSAGQVMFVGFNADGNDGFSFVTLVNLANGTNIRFNDNEWNGSPIGGGGAFNAGETSMTWNNNTGNTIFAGTVITISNSATTPAVTIGTITAGTIDLGLTNEVLYMFIGTNASTPTTFLSAIANDTFANGTIANTGLTAGSNALSIAGDEDVMIYTGSINCTSTIVNCTTALATTSNWTTQDTGADDSANGFPDFPTNVPCSFYGAAFGVVTYYSRNATLGGAWDDNNSWTTNSDGSGGPLATGVWPTRTDHVVIRTGHNITINATDDNKSCGISPDGLLRSNVGPFAASNLAMFYQIGDIQNNGTLTVTGIELMTEGYTKILTGGVFNLTSSYVNLGFLEADAGSTLSAADDLILAGNSNTIINSASISNDDLIISFTNATLCGTGTTTLQNGAGSLITYANGATVSQICTSFTVNCIGGGCSGFPVVGTNPVILGNSGPGGVGSNSGTSALVVWLDGNNGVTTSGTAVTSWNDQSGYSNNATQGTPANRPARTSNALNGLPIVQFDGVDDVLSISDQASIDLTRWSFLLVAKVTTHKNYNAFFVKGNDATENYEFLTNFPGTGNIHFPVYYTNGTRSGDAEIVAGPSMSNTSFGIFQYDYDNLNIRMFKNMTQLFTRAETLIPQVNASPLLVGNEGGTAGRNLSGDIAELVAYNTKLNLAQQIITNNYLSAKYGIALSASDLYSMDDVGNGNFDFNVAGIGQASDGSNHRDAKGSGVVRMWNPNGLANGEFLIWGHNSLNFSGGNTDVDGVIIQERLNRVWRLSEVGDVGTVSISVDLNGTLGSALGSNLRLLIDRDGDGFSDNDVTPVAGSFSGTVVTFSGINFQNGDRFTIGNTNIANPLPIELISFNATVQQAEVNLQWATASELNNDFFTIQRSQDAEDWEDVIEIKGAGNSNERIDYETTDGLPYTGVSYYRLKQTDFDKQYSYSGVKRVEVTQAFQLKVYPNPSSGTFRITTGFEILPEDVKFTNMLGQAIPIKLQHDGTSLIVNSDSISPGIYIIQVAHGYWRQSTRIVIE